MGQNHLQIKSSVGRPENRKLIHLFFHDLQVSLAVSNVDLDNKLANWGYDDIWRIIWMTLIFCVLTPLSRSAWALKKNFTLAMWLHIVRHI